MASIYGFGSNDEGRHGAGAALTARMFHGAIYGQAIGLQGRAYAIVTKNLKRGLRSVPLEWINIQVQAMFYRALTDLKDDIINMTPIGCGLAGYTPEEIAPMFKDAPPNVHLPPEFLKVLNNETIKTPPKSD